ncbi:hypothetical protein [endosymbiont GvMRE of Glomus versiforme]|uniref:hypothetical protein n=1 Tax=endosymbiont GvMRE of Glomus versiforme TaxID=2039283 RepID=UPI0011C45160|nr:hypothetical protein [endosymbiont GvMRE of Glomus versiforme]
MPTSDEVSSSDKETKRFFNPGTTVEDVGNVIEEGSKELLANLLKGLENFQPKNPTKKLSGIFSMPYLISIATNLITFVFIYLHLPFFATFFLLASIILNGLALIFDMILFIWVFNLIAILPGINKQKTGSGVYLAIWSLFFLLIVLVLIYVRRWLKLAKKVSEMRMK